jgi:hypothetical protein
MKTPSELFALMEWLSDFPDDLDYYEIIKILREGKDEWALDNIDVWEVVEDHPFDEVADFIEMTKKHFDQVVDQLLENTRSHFERVLHQALEESKDGL